VCTGFGNCALVENKDLIGSGDGGEAMTIIYISLALLPP
jgi:hypothetical protein